MWEQEIDEKMNYEEALLYAKNSRLGGYDDWRIPTIKELYSLIQFTGESVGEKAKTLFIDTQYFQQPLGDPSKGEREIDAQMWSSTRYVSYVMGKDQAFFGVNFVDGRIKGYPLLSPKTKAPQTFYVRLVRGNPSYGKNRFVNNEDGTLSDLATGLMWEQKDSSLGMEWKDALSYANNLVLAEHDDWRLPNAKELQSIVDYTRSPQTNGSPAIDSLFLSSSIIDPNNNVNYPYYWTSTTHLDGKDPEANAVYISFGEAQGKMGDRIMDVHGAGSQRSDPKSADGEEYPQFFGPQGDVRYVYNYVRAVRTLSQ